MTDDAEQSRRGEPRAGSSNAGPRRGDAGDGGGHHQHAESSDGSARGASRLSGGSDQSAGPTRRRFLRAGAAAGALAALGGLGLQSGAGRPAAGGYFPEGPTVGLQKVAAGPLVNPVGLVAAPGLPDRLFVVDQPGRIHVLGPDGLRPDPFLDVSDRLVDLDRRFDERGLLGLAFHPAFPENRRLFVRYSAALPPADSVLAGPPREVVPQRFDHLEVLAEYDATPDLSAADPDAERPLLEVPSPGPTNNAGDLAFGPDGYLYVPMGDGGGTGDAGLGHVEDWHDALPGGNGQDVLRNLHGSLLRLDVDATGGRRPYGIPANNPLVGTDALPEQYAWGFRNPWRLSVEGGTLLVADVGEDSREEVNAVERGGNYGWNVREGTTCFAPGANGHHDGECPDAVPDGVPGAGQPLLDPVVEYPHRAGGRAVGQAVVGGVVYRGDALPALRGRYVFGDWGRGGPRGRLLVATPPAGAVGGGVESPATGGGDAAGARLADDQWPVQEVVVRGGEDGEVGRFVQAFGRDADGEVYVLTSETGGPGGSGAVYRLVPPGSGEPIPTLGSGETTAGGGNATG